MTHEEITLETELIYKGKILNLRRDKVLAVGDKVAYREIVEHKGGVAIAAITEDGKWSWCASTGKPQERLYWKFLPERSKPMKTINLQRQENSEKRPDILQTV